MNIKKTANLFINFTTKRLAEMFGLVLLFLGLLLFVALFTYSPDDPNFIYNPENQKIQNIGGFYGSVISDFLLQSIWINFNSFNF